jgi:hypothetical protein
MARWCGPARRHAPAIWVEKGNGTPGPVSAQTLSMSQLLRWKWNSEKSFATGTHNSELPYGREGLEVERIEVISDPMRELIEELWPELVHKLPPKKPQG